MESCVPQRAMVFGTRTWRCSSSRTNMDPPRPRAPACTSYYERTDIITEPGRVQIASMRPRSVSQLQCHGPPGEDARSPWLAPFEFAHLRAGRLC